MKQALYSRDVIERSLSLSETITAVEKAFKSFARGDAQMPAKSYLEFPEHDGDLRTMPAYVPDFRYASVKIVNAHPNNPSQFKLPTVMALIVAVNPSNGVPVAVMDGTAITSKRTAAASAIATDQLARDQAKTLGFLGTGSQARDQFKAHLPIRDFQEILLYDRNPDSARDFREWLRNEHPNVSVQRLSAASEVVSRSDVVVSITPSKNPLLESIDLPDGIHINALGADAPQKQEWPDDIVSNCEIIVDSWEQASHSGEISQRINAGKIRRETIRGTLGEVLLEKPKLKDTRTLFDSTGLAIQDTAAVNAFLDQEVDPDAQFDFLNVKDPDSTG